VILAVFAASAIVALVVSAVKLAFVELIFVCSKASAAIALFVSAVILAVLAASAVVALVTSAVKLAFVEVILVLRRVSCEVALVISAVILAVFAAINVGNVEIVDELKPPTLFTTGAVAIPPKSFDNCTLPFTVVDASGVAAVVAAVTNAVVASCVVLVPAAGVGAVGVPVNAGDAIVALNAMSAIF